VAAPAVGSPKGRLRRFLDLLGPGFITGASDDDPSGIGTYAQAGASLGFATLWTALVTFPLMAAVQYTCAKIGLVSGMGLAGVLKRHYPRWLLYLVVALLLLANTINAGVDIGAIAAAVNLLVPAIPIAWMVVPFGLAIVALQAWGSYRLIERAFKWLALALLAYIGAAVFARPDWHAALRGTFVPTVSTDPTFTTTLVAILGTTISPYLFFWQASQEVEEEKAEGKETVEERQGASRKELGIAAWDVNIGMFVSNVVTYFIILATAATLHVAGKTDVQSATEAAQALRPLAGGASEVLLAIGLIGSGFLAVPILTGSAAFALSEAMGWPSGLDAKPHQAKRFYLAIAAATAAGLAINFVGINPMKALFWTGVLNGLLAPPVMVVIMLIANNRRIMGEEVNGTWVNVLGWVATALMAAAAIALVGLAPH
jgi:NRAMP (natural resistance-associated macrophage protein)-like metal ion transporter